MEGKGEAYHAVICTALPTEEHRFVVVDAFVYDAIWEHGLGSNAEDEHAEGQVIGRL